MSELTIGSRFRKYRILTARIISILLTPVRLLRNVKPSGIESDIVVFEWYMLGDMVMAAPVIDGLKAAYPDRCIKLFCDESWVPVAQYFIGVDEIVGVQCPWSPRHKKAFIKKVLPFLKTLRCHFSQPAFAICSLRGDPRDHLLQGLLPSTLKLGLQFLGAEYMLTHVANPGNKIHQIETACQVVEAIAPALSPVPQLNQDKALANAQRDLGDDFIAINLGASASLRQIPKKTCEQLDRTLSEKGYQYWFFHVGELDESFIKRRKKLDLSDYVGAIANASMVVCTDSATAHIAAALERPSLVLFGPTAPEICCPKGHAAIKVSVGPCPKAPCFGHCSYSSPHCMEHFDAIEIARLIEEFLVELAP